MKNKHWHKYLVFAAFCAAIYFPLFLHLDWQPMNIWDESLFAMRAGYMTEEGHYIRDYTQWVDNGIQHRSTKPPFTTWLQVASMKLLGINEVAMRIPIALCALGAVLLLVWFASQKLGNTHLGYCAGFVLVTTQGFVREHGCRTGDHDAALAFYMLAGVLAFYCYLEASTKRERLGWLAALTASTIAAVMTKYAFGLLFFPGMLMYAIYKRQVWNIVKRPSTWLAGLAVAGALGGWLWHIEQELPGFVEQAFRHEMADRYTSTDLGHEHPFSYYFERFWQYNFFMPWLLLLPLPLFLLFTKENSGTRLRDATLLLFFCAVIQLVVVSASQTKTGHYDLVAYPLLALLAGIGLYQVLKGFGDFWHRMQDHRAVLLTVTFAAALLLVVRPYYSVMYTVYRPKLTHVTNHYGYLLRKLKKHYPECNHFKIYAPAINAQVNYYAGLMNRNEGYHIRIGVDSTSIHVGDTVMACEPEYISYLLANFELKPIETYERCFLAIAKEKE